MFRRISLVILLAGVWLAFNGELFRHQGFSLDVVSAQGQNFTIGGRVTNPPAATGPGIADVTVTLRINDSTQTTTQTNSNGDFFFGNVPAGSNYLVTPAKPDWVFGPANQGGTNLSENRTLFFTGSAADPSPTPTPTPTPTPSPNSIQFAASTVNTAETPNVTTKVDLTVTRLGDSSGLASVSYATSDLTASDRSDYLTAIGTLQFGSGETSKTITVFIVNDSYGESAETFQVTLSNAVGATLGAPSVETVTINSDESINGPNPVKEASFDTDFFVRQHYVDFFNREADAPGLGFWKNQIDECTTQACRELRKINVSAAFFLSIEFQQTGYLVERLYKAAYGDAAGISNFGPTHQLAVPVIRLNEFLPDTQRIGKGVVIGTPGAEQLLESNKQTLISNFVLRSRFLTAYPVSMTPTQFVDGLNTNAGGVLSPSERTQLIGDLTTTAKTRAQVLRAVAEDPDLVSAESNRAFVLAQFFGYLRRNPNDVPDADYSGYDFWLTKLNQFGGNFVDAEMVKAFINSGEYQVRFGP